MADNWWEGDDDYSWLDDTVGGDDDTNWFGADDYSWMDDLDTFSADDFDANSDWWNDTDWWGDSFDDEGTYNYDPVGDMFDDTNTYGADDYSWMDNLNFGDDLFNTDTSPEGQISAWMDNYFNSGASTEGVGVDDFLPGGDYYSESEDETGIFGGTAGPKARKFFAELFGFAGGSGGKKTDGGGLGGLLASLAGGSKNMLDNDLIKILLGKKLLDDDREGGSAGYIPIGQEAYGGGGNQPSYQISNIQPALLPGMAYANQPTTFNNMPPPTAPPATLPGMQAGGLAHHHPQLHSHAHGSRPNDIPGMPGMQDLLLRPDGMQSGGIASLENRMEGPGDITKAMLEPGEFVMTRKATQNLTPEYLYSLMHQAENAGRMR